MTSTELAPVEQRTDAPRHVELPFTHEGAGATLMVPWRNGIRHDARSSTILPDRRRADRTSEDHRDEPDDDHHHRDHQQPDAQQCADPAGREAFGPIGLFVRKA